MSVGPSLVRWLVRSLVRSSVVWLVALVGLFFGSLVRSFVRLHCLPDACSGRRFVGWFLSLSFKDLVV